MTGAAAFLDAQTLPGWFGKLPGLGDFAHRRLPEAFRARLDGWLHDGLQRLRLRHDDWTERYLQGPLWYFAMGRDVAGAQGWLGVLMPSVDAVGRYFPMVVAAPVDAAPGGLETIDTARAVQWWDAVAQAAFEGLEQDLDATGFDAALQRHRDAVPPVAAAASSPVPAPIVWPDAGRSLWLTGTGAVPALRILAAGLPVEARFDALFGFVDETWVETVEAA